MSVFHNTFTSKFEKQNETLRRNSIVSDYNFFDIYLTALISTFKWGGDYDKTLNPFMIEQGYQFAGMVAHFMKDGVLKIYPCFPNGTLLENGEFSSYTAISYNGENYDLDYDDVVVGYNNCMKTPYYTLVKFFSDKTSYALKAVEASLKRAIRGKVFVGLDESELKTLGSLTEKNSELKEFLAVLGNDSLNNEDIKTLTLHDNREVDILSLWDVNVRYRNLFYSTIGINNVEIQKRERLTEAEGSGNDEIVRFTLLNDMYERRLETIEKVKEKFGKIITCEIERDSATVYNLIKDNNEKLEDNDIVITKGANIQKESEDFVNEN